jgi:hypothetical protein
MHLLGIPAIHRLLFVVVLLGAGVHERASAAENPKVKPRPVNPFAVEWESWLRSSDQLVLYSIDAYAARRSSSGNSELGRIVLTDPQERFQVSEAVICAIGRGFRMRCFTPRHVVEATKDGKVLTVVMCFECGNVEVTAEGKQTRRLSLSPAPAAYFNRLLAKAGIPVAP